MHNCQSLKSKQYTLMILCFGQLLIAIEIAKVQFFFEICKQKDKKGTHGCGRP